MIGRGSTDECPRKHLESIPKENGMSEVKSTTELPLVLTMRHVQKITGLSRSKTYELAHRQDFPAVRFGRVIRVPRDAFLRWLDAQAESRKGV
jgi:excisionase family DNA binding protein